MSAVAVTHGMVWAGTEQSASVGSSGTAAVDDVGGMVGGACVSRIYLDPRSRTLPPSSATY